MTDVLRYRTCPLAWEESPEDEGTVFVAGLPQGPPVRIEGSAVQVLAVLDEAESALTLEEILARLRQVIAHLPPHAGQEVEEFLRSMMHLGVVRVDGAEQ